MLVFLSGTEIIQLKYFLTPRLHFFLKKQKDLIRKILNTNILITNPDLKPIKTLTKNLKLKFCCVQ